MSREIDYGNLMHDAMRGLIRKVLLDVADRGLPGEHHFFITFDTSHPDAELADWLSDRYPGEMTVVMQHWYDGLDVTEEGFSITLNFGDSPEPLKVPFDALRTFVDPSVEFGLRFESYDTEDDEGPELHDVVDLAKDEAPEFPAEPEPEPAAKSDPEPKPDVKTDTKADVVSLDSFRKS